MPAAQHKQHLKVLNASFSSFGLSVSLISTLFVSHSHWVFAHILCFLYIFDVTLCTSAISGYSYPYRTHPTKMIKLNDRVRAHHHIIQPKHSHFLSFFRSFSLSLCFGCLFVSSIQYSDINPAPHSFVSYKKYNIDLFFKHPVS